MAATTIRLKLLIDPNSNRILIGEAGKDFVDFLFLILALPVGSVTKLLTKNNMEGCLGDLYDSIEKLGDNYIHSKTNINTLLNPIMVSDFAADPARRTTSPPDEGGYVKNAVTYMITDGLMVSPMSVTSLITLLNKFNIKDVGVLQEKVVDVRKEAGLELLRASVQSKTVLTDVFLRKTYSKKCTKNSGPVCLPGPGFRRISCKRRLALHKITDSN